MSKRFKAEIEFKKNTKEEEFNRKLLHNIKVAERKQKEKNKNLNANDFPIIKEIPEHRDRNLWKRKSYNKDKQIEEFIGYTYFKYEAPFWAIKYIEYIISGINNIIERNPNLKNIKNNISNHVKYKLEKDEFIFCVSNGELLFSAMNGKGIKTLLYDLLTNKEIHYFLTSKEESITGALLDAKLKTFNLNKNKHNFLLNRFKQYKLFANNIDQVYLELIYFLAKNDVDENSSQEILDYFNSLKTHEVGYIRFEDKNILAKDFFKKSLNTIIQLSNDYHIRAINAKNQRYFEWSKTLPDTLIFNKYLFKELSSSNELSKEGRDMKHCVGSYASSCFNGSTRIVSLSLLKNDNIIEKLLTIEIYQNRIIQVKGKCNRSPNQIEIMNINEYAAKNNLIYL